MVVCKSVKDFTVTYNKNKKLSIFGEKLHKLITFYKFMLNLPPKEWNPHKWGSPRLDLIAKNVKWVNDQEIF